MGADDTTTLMRGIGFRCASICVEGQHFVARQTTLRAALGHFMSRSNQSLV
jgi:hypothetical protein